LTPTSCNTECCGGTLSCSYTISSGTCVSSCITLCGTSYCKGRSVSGTTTIFIGVCRRRDGCYSTINITLPLNRGHWEIRGHRTFQGYRIARSNRISRLKYFNSRCSWNKNIMSRLVIYLMTLQWRLPTCIYLTEVKIDFVSLSRKKILQNIFRNDVDDETIINNHLNTTLQFIWFLI